MLALANYDWQSICYRFPGVKNEIEFSRYKWARLFKKPYEYAFLKSLQKAQILLASADEKTIADLVARSNGMLKKSKIVQFPTRVDTDIFSPQSQAAIRSQLGIKLEDKIVVACGRIRHIKGWDFLLQAFQIAQTKVPGIKLIFVGDGEDRSALEKMSKSLGIADKVQVTGAMLPPKVAQYLNAADLFVVGSYHEGWPTAMLEALACGKPVVSTNVSGAAEMIINSQNGYIVPNRNPKEYADAMAKTLQLKNASQVSLHIASKYTIANLPKELGALWKPLA
jgi:glycosyltransferase involved in cell wall biosynthesis